MIHLPDPSLDRLVFRANLGSSSGQRAVWFADCSLKGNVLFVPDLDMAGFIRRCFLDKLRSVVSDLEIRVGVPELEPRVTAPKVNPSVWKKGKEPTQQRLAAGERDE